MMPRNVSSATTSPPNAMTNVRPRKAWMYGAAERIHWTNARVVAEWAAGALFGVGGIGAAGSRGRKGATIIAPRHRAAGAAQL